MNSLKTVNIPKMNVAVSAMGMGCMPLSIQGRPSEKESISVIHRALDLGVTIFDTADSYCLDEQDKHHNERLIHKAISELRSLSRCFRNPQSRCCL